MVIPACCPAPRYLAAANRRRGGRMIWPTDAYPNRPNCSNVSQAFRRFPGAGWSLTMKWKRTNGCFSLCLKWLVPLLPTVRGGHCTAQHSTVGYIFGKKVGWPHHSTIFRAHLCVFLGNQQHWGLLFSFTFLRLDFKAASTSIRCGSQLSTNAPPGPTPDLPGAIPEDVASIPAPLQLCSHTMHACCLPRAAHRHGLPDWCRMFRGRIRQWVMIVLSNWLDKIRHM